MFDVPQVEGEPPLPTERIPSMHLGPSGDSRRHIVAAQLDGRISFHILSHQRPGTNQAHVSAQHVQQLRQFIETRAA